MHRRRQCLGRHGNNRMVSKMQLHFTRMGKRKKMKYARKAERKRPSCSYMYTKVPTPPPLCLRFLCRWTALASLKRVASSAPLTILMICGVNRVPPNSAIIWAWAESSTGHLDRIRSGYEAHLDKYKPVIVVTIASRLRRQPWLTQRLHSMGFLIVI